MSNGWDAPGLQPRGRAVTRCEEDLLMLSMEAGWAAVRDRDWRYYVRVESDANVSLWTYGGHYRVA